MPVAQRIRGISRAPAVPVIPAVGTLKAHYDFSDITQLFQAVALATPVTTNGQTIKSVKDKSANEYTMSEATNGPTYTTGAQNGRSCARFDGTNDTLRTAVGEPWGGAQTAWTIFVAAKKQTAVDGSLSTLFETDQGASTAGYLVTSTSLNGAGDKGSFSSSFTIVPNWLPSTASIVVVRATSVGSLDLYGNGGSPTNINPTDQAVTDGRRSIGSRGAVGDGFGNFDVYEYAEFTTALSAADMNSVGAYLGTKWGITWNTIP